MAEVATTIYDEDAVHSDDDPLTRLTEREKIEGMRVSGGTLVRHEVGTDGHTYHRFVPATREVARTLLRHALRGSSAK